MFRLKLKNLERHFGDGVDDFYRDWPGFVHKFPN